MLADNENWLDHVKEIEDTGIMYVDSEDYDWLMDLLADNEYDTLEINLDDPMFDQDYCEE